MSKKYPRNSLCPCGSGKKYKKCCINKNFNWVIEDGTIRKSIKLNAQLMEVIEKQHQRFIDTYGREPGPGDPIFFEQYLYSDEEYENKLIEILEQINVDPAIIYAFRKTQRIVTLENRDMLTDLELKEWKQAVDEYYEINNNTDTETYMIMVEPLIALEKELKNSLLIFSLIIFKYGEIDAFRNDMAKYSLKDYIIFCVTKIFKTIKTIIIHLENGFIEDAFVLLRTIYESYLNIVLILHKPGKLDDLIARAGLSQGTHEYAKNKKGKPDRRRIIDKRTGLEFQGNISTHYMASCSDFDEDILIHDILYLSSPLIQLEKKYEHARMKPGGRKDENEAL